MANMVVNSQVMREKAKTIETAATTIDALYAEMLNEITTTTNKMQGTTVETAKEKFANMQGKFDTMVQDMKKYYEFLMKAADAYEKAENSGLQKVQRF